MGRGYYYFAWDIYINSKKIRIEWASLLKVNYRVEEVSGGVIDQNNKEGDLDTPMNPPTIQIMKH